MRRNRFGKALFATVAVLAMLVGGAAIAQEQSGSITGTVTDKDGAVLPGVTVEAMSAGGATLVSVSDIKGEYRFPSLRSGVYKLTAKLDGFVTAEVPDVSLELGRTLRINFTLQPGTFEDTITVAADTVAIDVTQSSTATSMSREEITLLPHGRDFTTVVGPGSRRLGRGVPRRHLDRRLFRLREPLRHRRHRHHRPAERRVCSGPGARLRRGGPGQVGRVRRRVRRLDRRRDQRHHQDRQQRLPRRRGPLLPRLGHARRQAAVRKPSTPTATTRRSFTTRTTTPESSPASRSAARS